MVNDLDKILQLTRDGARIPDTRAPEPVPGISVWKNKADCLIGKLKLLLDREAAQVKLGKMSADFLG